MKNRLGILIFLAVFFFGTLVSLIWWQTSQSPGKKTEGNVLSNNTETPNNQRNDSNDKVDDKDREDVLGISDVANRITSGTSNLLNRLTNTNSSNPNPTSTPTSTTTNPTNTPVPGQPTATSVPGQPSSTPTPVPKVFGYIKALPNSKFGATVTSNGVTKAATDGMQIYPGDKVETQSDTRVQVVMPADQSNTNCIDTSQCTFTRLDKNTVVQVNSNTSNADFNADISIEAGKVWNRIKKLTGQESYDSQSGNMVATVRGTSYGHALAFENNLATDRIYTIEGRVFGQCKRNPSLQGEITENQRATFKCDTNDILNLIEQLASMDQADLDWLIYNTKLDRPQALEENQPPEVVINTPSTDLPNNVDSIDINATITDDGKPYGGVASVWTINGLPCVGLCSHPFSADTKVTFPSSGIYTMKLTATDLLESSSSEITVAVNILRDNKPPVPVAGPDITITLPDKATLNGSVTDDGFPVKKFIVNWWTLVKGPASVSFSNAFSADSIATFTKAGTYTLRLNSFDGDKQSFDDIVVVVLPAPTPTPLPTATPTPTPTPSPAAFIDVSEDTKEASIRIENLFTYKSLTYEFGYDSDQEHQGVNGGVNPIENNRYQQMIPFGTCSTNNVCTYHTGIRNVLLKVLLKDAEDKEKEISVQALTTPSPTPTETPTPTNTPTITPTPSGPVIDSASVSIGTCIGTACGATFDILGQNLSTATTYTLYKGSYSRTGAAVTKSANKIVVGFILVNKNNGYKLKVKFANGQEIVAPGTFNLN